MTQAAWIRRHAEAAIYAAVAVSMWPVPLLNRLHAESNAVLAAAAWGVAGVVAARAFRRGAPFGTVLQGRLVRLGVPLALMMVPVLWAPNCDWPHGLLLFLLFPVISAGLAVSVAWAVTGLRARRPASWILLGGLAVAVVVPVYDVGLHPQFYTYNHVFGGVLGPLYDEEIVWRPGLFAFRALSLLWAVLGWGIGTAARRLPGDLRRAGLVAAGIASLLIVGTYAASGRLGITTSGRDLARSLSQAVPVGEAMVLHVHPDTAPHRLRRLVSEAAFRYAVLRDTLGTAPEAAVQVWVYPDADVRGRLTGARVTSVAPVWLREPQVHVLDEQFEDVFAHELVHAFSRAFGMPVLHASPAVGLVEGLAVALEPPDGGPDADEQVAAVRTDRTAARLAASLSPWGFWGGRGSVSYTTTGSFVRYLGAAYGLESVRSVYADADFDAVFGRPPDELAAAWIGSLDGRTWLPVDASRRATSRFAVPSLFERRCPHYVPPAERLRRASNRAWERGDTLAAVAYADQALEAGPERRAVVAHWLRMRVRLGRLSEARAVLERHPDVLRNMNGAVVAADLDALAGRPEAAFDGYDRVRRGLGISAREARATLTVRRVLADRPEAVGALVLAGPERVRADFLSTHVVESPWHAAALRTAEALLRIEDEAYAEAARALESVRIPDAGAGAPIPRGETVTWRLQRFAWMSEALEADGDLPGAVAYADSAAAYATSVGDRTAARYWGDQRRRLVFTLSPASSYP